jgi:undecaprenyl-diphosphatase
MSLLANLDWSILNWIHAAFRNSFLDFAMPRITALGNGGAVWIACALILILSRKHRRHGLLLLIGLAAGELIGNVILKNIIARPRPCWLNPDIRLLIAIPASYSFPSGHTLSSFLAATILGRTDRRIGFAAFPLACLIAFSRLYLYVHFPSDVLCGALIGIVLGYLITRANEINWTGRRLAFRRARQP